MAESHDKVERDHLIQKLRDGHGTTVQAEQWIVRLREIDPLFDSSDYMYQLEIDVKARRVADELTAQIGVAPAKEHLVDLVRQIQRGDGTEAEDEGRLNVLARSLPNSKIGDLIYYSDPELSPEEVVEQALRSSLNSNQ